MGRLQSGFIEVRGSQFAVGSCNLTPRLRTANRELRTDMANIKLTTPIDEKTIRSLHVGDTVTITGLLYTGRDAVHHRLHTGVKPPVDLAGQIIYHCGPLAVGQKGGRGARAGGALA